MSPLNTFLEGVDGDVADEQEGTSAVGGVESGTGGEDQLGQGGGAAGAVLPPNETGLVAAPARGRRRRGAPVAWPPLESAGKARSEEAGAAIVSREVRRLRSHARGGGLGRGRRVASPGEHP